MADVLGTAVGVISLGIQVADGLIKYYTAYKDREADTSHTVKRLTNLLNLFEVLRTQLANRTSQPDEQSLLEVIERSVGDCEELIGELQRETEKFTKTPSSAGVTATARTMGRRLAYPFRQSTLQKLDEDIDEICAHLNLALQVLRQQDIGSVQDELQDTKALLELVRASQVSADVEKWLRAPDASINYYDACKKKHAGTGLWLVKRPQFTTWLTSSNSFLWLNGFAGCGKSVLSSTAIQHTFRHRRSNPRVGIAFFYFTFNDESKQDTSAMLRALILQLVSQLGSEQAILHICPGFIEVNRDSRKDGHDWSTVRIAHYSVQEYLESDRIRLTATARFHVDRIKANTEVASICLAYLLHPGLCMPLDAGSRSRDYPLTEYAVTCWVVHYWEGSSTDARLHDLVLRLFRDTEGVFASWFKTSILWTTTEFWLKSAMYNIAAGMSPLNIAAALGLDALVRTLLPATTNSAYRKKSVETALIAAVMEGRASTTHLLMKHDVDVNYVGSEGTALHVASERGDVAIMEVQMMMAVHAARWNLRSPVVHEAGPVTQKDPVQNAADSMTLLDLKHGGAGFADTRHRTPLEAAVECGQVEIVTILLGRGADVDKAGGYGNLLQIAASKGRVAVLQLLLDMGADVSKGKSTTPLLAMFLGEGGRDDVVSPGCR